MIRVTIRCGRMFVPPVSGRDSAGGSGVVVGSGFGGPRAATASVVGSCESWAQARRPLGLMRAVVERRVWELVASVATIARLFMRVRS